MTEYHHKVDVRLRTDRVQYLEYRAQRDEISLSQALESIIDAHAPLPTPRALTRPGRIERKHLTIDGARLAVIDRLALEWGLMRSDVAARLIDEARQDDPILMLAARYA